MKVCIHLQPASRTLGGAEVLAANVALVIQERHKVEIVHHRPWLDIGQLATFAGAQFLPGQVTARFIERRADYLVSRSWNPIAMFREPREWGRALAGDCDLLMTLTHQLPPFNPAPHGVLFLLFPMSTPLDAWPFVVPPNGQDSFKGRSGRWFHRRQYDALWRGYDVKLAISEFTARWAKKRWAIDCDVLSPLVDCSDLGLPKEDVILTLGRYSVSGVSKHQREMAEGFSRSGVEGWRLICLGAAHTDQELAYVEEVRSQGPRVDPRVNASHRDVREWLSRARIFWHAAGLTEQESVHPDRLEHFGIATVEAMANGCVPVVIGRGGQPEIVEHEVSGFLCDGIDEMVARTNQLIGDPDRLARMAVAARERSRAFDRQSFERRFRQLVSSFQRRAD